MIVLILSILGSVFSLGGNILIAHKKRSGWLWWIAGNGAWIAVNFLGQMNVPMVLMYVAYFIINVTGYREWRKEADIVKTEDKKENDNELYVRKQNPRDNSFYPKL